MSDDRSTVEPHDGRPAADSPRRLDAGSGRRASDDLFGALLSSVRDGVWAASVDGSTVVYLNPAVERIYGRSAAEFYANPGLWLEVVHPEDRQIAQESVRRLFEHGAVQSEYRILRPNGEVRWIHDRKNVVTDRAGNPVGMGGIATDITERKRADEKLRTLQQRFDVAVRGSNDGLWDWDLRTDREWWSPLFYELLGYEDGDIEASYSTFKSLLHPDDRERTLDAVRAHLEQHARYDIEYRLRHKSGEYRWIRARGQALWDEAGEPLRMAGSIQDITERKQAEQALRESESRLRLALEALNGGVWDWNVQTGEVHFTPSWARMLGYEPHEIEGHVRTWSDALHPDDTPAIMNALNEHFEHGTPYFSEHRMRTKDGRWIWVLDRGRVVERDADGRPLRMTGTDVDITVRKQAEEERRGLEMQVRHAQKLESLGILAGGIAHDFNNILTGILGNAELAARVMASSDPAQGYLAQVQESSIRAADLCQQLLAYSGKGRFLVKPFNLSELVQDMLELLKVSISKKAELHIDLQSGLPAIEADVNQVRQIVMNLITNASEALGDGGGRIVLRTSLAEASADPSRTRYDGTTDDGPYVCLEVSDTGCGMDEDTKARIFDPFFTTKFTGRGLGLAAVLGIVRSHEGAIELSGRPGQGTTFRVLFQACDRSRQPIDEPQKADADWRGEATVLVVDDEESVRNVACAILGSRGLDVLTASDGREAVELYRRRPREIDAVLLDLTMPGMSGPECMAVLRELDPNIKILLTSGYNEQDVIDRLGDQGVAGFVQKPYRQAEFIAKLREVLD